MPAAAVHWIEVGFAISHQYYQNVKKVSPDTIRAYRSDLKLFGLFLATQGIARLTQVDHPLITRYIDQMKATPSRRSAGGGLSDATVARRLAAVSSFLDFVRVTRQPKLHNPIQDFFLRWKRNNRPKPVEHQVIEQLLQTITVTRDRVLIQLFLASGLRLSEMARLNRDSITIERTPANGSSPEMVLGVGDALGKGGKTRSFYVHAKVLVAVMRYLNDRKDEQPALFISERRKRMSVRTMQERLAHWCRQAGVSRVNVHRLRHTYATNLVNAEMDILQIKELLGHNSLATTLQYTKISDTAVARGYHAAMEYVDL